MSGRSSWSGASGHRASDIIDLDHFMRGGVRPSRPDAAPLERLVVDGGGRRIGASGSVAGRRGTRPRRAAKRFSHDSGLSDDSRGSHGRGRRTTRTVGSRLSRESLREFRAACERALLEQQRQIARVVRLCERLARRRAASSDGSGASSSGRTAPARRTADECTTYEIIVAKLDELNRAMGARARAAASSSGSGSVSVSDKVVGTEPRAAAVRRCETRTRGDLGAHSAPAEGSAGDSGASACDARCGFDLEDPVHLYSQAKRLQGERASAAGAGRGRASTRVSGRAAAPPGPTLCALCRGYWRSLRQFVVAQLYGAGAHSDAF